MSCQARVLNQELTFPNSNTTYHTTKECGEIATHKYSVDGGDASMSICGNCLRRCITKKSPNSNWYGFFDCAYPPEAKVKGSRWYFWQLHRDSQEEAEAVAPPQAVMEDELPIPQASPEIVGYPKEEEAEAPSAKDLLTAQIAELQGRVKSSRNTMPVKEQAKILKQIMDIRLKLVELKKNK